MVAEAIGILIHPITAYSCFAVAILFFRKKNVSIADALMFPLRRAALKWRVKTKDIFTNTGILIILLGFVIGSLWVTK